MIRSRSLLLAGTHMTAAERSMGRFMRAPDEHPAGEPAAPAAPPEPDPAPAAGEPAAPAAAEPPAPEDAFAAAFAKEALPEPVVVPPGGVVPTEPLTPAPAAPAAPAAPEPAAPAAPPAPAAPAAAPTAAEIAAELARAMPPMAPAAPAAPAAEQPSLYSPEEQEVLTNYAKDWPDVRKAEQLERRAEYHDLLAYIFKEVNTFITPTIEQVRAMGNSLHTGELKVLVPDYTPLVEADVNAWIDTQPNYLQTGMKAVMQGGTSDEVADLIGRYRAASGTTSAPAAPAAPAPAPAAPGAPAAPKAPRAPAAPRSELSEAAKQAAESLAPVASERSQVPVGEDSQDFDSAFAKYAATV